MYKVYIKIDSAGRIIDINSDAFLSSLDGWQEIDNGIGDKYHHAQGNYLPKAIMDDYGVYRYKLVDGKPVERTQAEMDADRPGEKEEQPTLESRVETVEEKTEVLEEALGLILSGVTE